MAQSDGLNGKSRPRSARCIALIGPYLSGKTTLLEAILARTGAVTRQGTIKEKSTVGDASRGGAGARHERRAQRGRRRVPGRQADFHRLPRLHRVPAGGGQCAGDCRCGNRGVRAGSQAGAGAASDPQAARGHEAAALPVPQQNRHVRRAGAGHSHRPATGEHASAGAAADPDLGERHCDGIRRSRAGTRLRLPGACPVGGGRDAERRCRSQERSPLPDAGEARGLRRRADGAVAGRHRAAARPGVRRSRQGAQGRVDRAGAAGLGGERQRYRAAAEGVAARGAIRRDDGRADRARRCCIGSAYREDAVLRARRQAVGCPRACG